jgi:hypothetical protein
VVLMEYPEDIFRTVNWPEIGEVGGKLNATIEWLRVNATHHEVYLPQEKFDGRPGMQAWLIERFGPPMIQRSSFGTYYWTSGRWISVVRLRRAMPDGRDYLFTRSEDAFEFKMRWR